MTVKELIDRLLELNVDDECEVYIDAGDINYRSIDEANYDPSNDCVVIE